MTAPQLPPQGPPQWPSIDPPPANMNSLRTYRPFILVVASIVAVISTIGLVAILANHPSSQSSQSSSTTSAQSVGSLYSGTWTEMRDGYPVGTFVVNANSSDPGAIASNNGLPLQTITGNNDSNNVDQFYGISMDSNSFNFTRNTWWSGWLTGQSGSHSESYSLHRSGNNLVGTATMSIVNITQDIIWTQS